MLLGVILLAAGASSRMGQPKLLLPWGHRSILSHLLEQWRVLGALQTTVVIGASQSPIAAELSRLSVREADRIINPDPSQGMFSSIQCAARWPGWKAELTHWVLSLGDQPHVHLDTLHHLLDVASLYPEKICQPARLGRPKHPILFPKSEFLELAHSSSPDLKSHLALRPNRRQWFDCEDAGLDFDIDQPADYQRALAWAGLGGQFGARD